MSSRRIKSWLDMAATIAVLAAATVALIVFVRSLAGPPPPPPPAPPVDAAEGRIERSAITKSRGKGRVALVEFGDYECPYCAQHTREVAPAIAHEFVETGLIRHIFFNSPQERIHPRAFGASEVAECAAAQGRFWDMHERLFENLDALDDPRRHAEALGLDRDAFERCLSDEGGAGVRRDLEEGQRLGVRGTPMFFIGTMNGDGSIELVRQINGAQSMDTFRDEITAALEGRIAGSQATRSWWPF